MPTYSDPELPEEPALLLIVTSSIDPLVLISIPLFTLNGYTVLSSAR